MKEAFPNNFMQTSTPAFIFNPFYPIIYLLIFSPLFSFPLECKFYENRDLTLFVTQYLENVWNMVGAY